MGSGLPQTLENQLNCYTVQLPKANTKSMSRLQGYEVVDRHIYYLGQRSAHLRNIVLMTPINRPKENVI